MSYSVLMTAYNEEKLVGETIESILGQSIKPEVILVVNDGSTDATESIIKQHKVSTINVHDKKYPLASFNMVRALNKGYSKIKHIPFDYLLKIDADSVIPEDYVERLITIMKNNPTLGIVSGNIKGMKIWEHRCSDGARLYRKTCFDEIGGLDFIVHWDTHAIVKAYKKGWLVRTVYTIEYNELRSHERSSLYDWYVSGIARHYHGFPVYHTFSVFLIRITDKPMLGSTVMFITFLIYSLFRKIKTNDYRKYAKTFSAMELKHRGGAILKNWF